VNKKQGDNLQSPEAKSKRRRRNKGMCLEATGHYTQNALRPGNRVGSG